MRRIVKGTEPRSLVEHRATPGAAFNGCNKADIRKGLFDEQRGLCCYCCGRIASTHVGMKIEHFVAQSTDPTLTLSYQNMLGACGGGMGNPPKLQHCDTRRGDRPIRFSPADPQRDIHSLIFLSSDGRITSPDPIFTEQLDDTLGLNLPRLVLERKKQVAAVALWWKDVHSKQHRRPSHAEIVRKIQSLEPPLGDLVPFQFAAIWWLKNRVKS